MVVHRCRPCSRQTNIKEISGVCCAISGPTSYFPMCAFSKTQGAVNHSTAESEMVTADIGLRAEALPLMTLFDAMSKRQIICSFLQDNQATLRNMREPSHGR